MQRLTAIFLILIAAGAAVAEEPWVAVVASDYVTGKLATLGSASPWPAACDLSSVCSDAVARYSDGRIYVINRLGCDNVQVIDPAAGFATVDEISVGGGSNPQGIAFSPDGTRAYVPLQNTDEVLILNPATGATLGSVDLSAWADADGSCELGDLIRVGDLIFVAILRLDRDFYWLPVGDSYLAVIDTNTDALLDVSPGTPGIQAIPLVGSNPAWELQRGPDGMLYAACVGYYGLTDGGLERVDPNSLASLGFAITEAALGGDIGDVAFVSASQAYCIVGDASFNTNVMAFDPSTGGGVSLFLSGAGFVFTDMEIDASGDLYLTDQSLGASGVRVYDAASGAPLAAAISTCLPPYDLLVPGGEAVGVENPPAAAAARLTAWPNPFNPRTKIAWLGLAPGAARLAVYDIAGRRVAGMPVGEQPGAGSVDWSALDGEGRPLPSGVYLARISAGGTLAETRLNLIR